jgi:hypothetical protein
MGTQVKLTGISDSGRTRKSYASPGLDTTNVPPGQSVLAPVETYTGRLLRVFTKSHFLDYLARNTGGHVEPIMYRGQRFHLYDKCVTQAPEPTWVANSLRTHHCHRGLRLFGLYKRHEHLILCPTEVPQLL